MTQETPPFRPYPKIRESSSAWESDEAVARQLKKLTWIATEKIHGANFSFHLSIQDRVLRCAKRKAILNDSDTFFHFQKLKERYQSALWQLFDWVLTHNPKCQQLGVYGELYGGEYKHPEVKAVTGVEAVQTGVYYSPDIEFCAFDLQWRLSDEDWSFIDYDTATDWLTRFDLPINEVLFRGSLEQAYEQPIDFPSTIPKRHGLPELPDNSAEGLVIKPVQPVLVPTKKGPMRPIIKRKTARFQEDARYHQAQVWDSKPGSNAASYALDLLEWSAKALVTKQRLQNALSKTGRDVSRTELFRALISDVEEQLREDHAEEWSALAKAEKELLMAVVEDDVDELLTKEWD